ncbi:hypothetical protein [Paraglaciecola marina]|uniref:hypothetical protein n=1 Tax=Paraglaciecola marina TaxID=2500157 RepID=UPI0010602867|nr:hypothetical protein [Paraglaciecola marina]
MLNHVNIEVLTKKDVLDEVVEAKSVPEALAMAFGGKESDYYPCNNISETGVLYCTECNGVYEMFAKVIEGK